MKYEPHNYQKFAEQHIMRNLASGLFLEMGLGKTVTTLTAVNRLLYDEFDVNKVLVIAPKFVALNVWQQEAQKWEHLRHLRFSIVTGDPGQRVRALKAKADIYVINRENVTWLVNFYQTGFPFDMVIIDELSSFKDHQSQRFKSLRIVRPLIKRVVGLTGTPSPNGLHELWPQLYLLDQGERLGKTVTGFREAFLSPDKMNGHHVLKYKVRKGSEEDIYARISDICISMKSEDYLELPGRIEQDVTINFDPATQKKYDDFERHEVLQILDQEITVANAAALINKLLQFSNGAVYDRERQVHHIHDIKLEVLAELIEQAGDQQVLVFYNFQHDCDRILKRFKGARKLVNSKDIDDWNKKKAGIMVCHPASAGHGLNLQDGGHIIVWFGPIYSLELYQQANARLDRQGQTKPVMIYRIVCERTMDPEVVSVIERKAEGQGALMDAVKAKIKKYSLV